MLCNGQTYFQNFYKTGYYNYYSTNVFPQPDSSHVVFNYIQDSVSGRQDLALLKIDKNGNELIKKTYNIFNTDYLPPINGLKQFVTATNSSFLSSSVVYTSSIAGVVFTKINRNTLDTIKNAYYYDGIYSYYLSTYLKFNDNKYYLIGSKSNSSGQWPFIFQIDSNLNVNNSITVSNLINIGCNNAVFNPVSKRILFAGNIVNGSNQQNIGFIEADTLGIVTNTSIISISGIQGISQLKYSQFDNSYIFNGGIRSSKYGNNNMYRLMVGKINAATLSLAWQKTYGSAAIINNLYTVINNPDGSIVTCGAYSDSTSLPLMNYDTKGVILKTNANGDSLWMRQYNNYTTGSSPSNYRETFFGVERTLDGGYILCGNVLNQPAAKAWIVKTDSLGCVNAGCGSIITSGAEEIENMKSELEIYPNPANDFILLKLGNSISGSHSIRITDVAGKEIMRITDITDPKVNIQGLFNGLYFLNLYQNESLTATEKLIILR